MALVAVLTTSVSAVAQTVPDRAQEFSGFIAPAYPMLLARAGAFETDPQKLAALAQKAAAGLAAVAPADCDAQRFRTDLCGMQILLEPSSSMEPSLLEGELIVRKPYIGKETPRRGDIVTFDTVPANSNRSATYVKRIIGLPGEKVELINGTVFVDGKSFSQSPTDLSFESIFADEVSVLEETAPEGRRYHIGMSSKSPSDRLDNAGPFQVPEGACFVLGDNRHNSADSRFPDQMGKNGFVPGEDITGRVVTIMVSKDQARIGLLVE